MKAATDSDERPGARRENVIIVVLGVCVGHGTGPPFLFRYGTTPASAGGAVSFPASASGLAGFWTEKTYIQGDCVDRNRARGSWTSRDPQEQPHLPGPGFTGLEGLLGEAEAGDLVEIRPGLVRAHIVAGDSGGSVRCPGSDRIGHRLHFASPMRISGTSGSKRQLRPAATLASKRILNSRLVIVSGARVATMVVPP